MKSSEQLKKELHEYIDSIEDDETLLMVHEEVVGYFATEVDDNKDDDDLTEDQNRRLDEAIRQADEGKVMDIHELKRRMSLWHIS